MTWPPLAGALIILSAALSGCARHEELPLPPPPPPQPLIVAPEVPDPLRSCPGPTPPPPLPDPPRTVAQLVEWAKKTEAARRKAERARRECERRLKSLNTILDKAPIVR